MEDLFVFQDDKEIDRLRVQNRLLYPYEKTALDSIFANFAKESAKTENLATREGLAVLDIGCNDGKKTVSIFSYDSISHVVGLEYNEKLAQKAQKEFGDNKFFFSTLDVEKSNFTDDLAKIMQERGIKAFDCIYLSFVLMHLKNPKKLLATLQNVLKDDGYLVVVEANDSTSYLTGDVDNLLGTFLDILNKDKYSGNRFLGSKIEKIIEDCGYEDIRIWCEAISAKKGELEKKEDIFTTFFSYLSEDVDILIKEEDCEEYRTWNQWLLTCLPLLKSLILKENSEISMGMKILSCKKNVC